MARLLAIAALLLAACGDPPAEGPAAPPSLAQCVANPACTRPLVVGHGSNTFFAPPNTLLGFELARGQGADLVQLDIQVSRDGKAVALYHQQLGVWTSCTGSVTDNLSADIVQCGVYDANSERVLYQPPTQPRPTVPLLGDVLAWAKGRVNLVLEIQKDPSGVALKEVVAAGMVDQVLFLVDELEYLLLRQVSDNDRLPDGYVVYHARSAAEVREALKISDPHLLAVEGDKDWMDAALVGEVHAAGKKTFVNTFSPTDPQATADELAGKDRCQTLFDLGYDLVQTNRPDLCSGRRLVRLAP